ncbi:MAG: class I SAM-dependent methyltransferase [Bdellovibrionia bacterium]
MDHQKKSETSSGLLTECRCPFCSQPIHESKKSQPVDNHSPLFEKIQFRIADCASCGIGVTYPQVHPDKLELLYSGRSSNDFHPNENNWVRRIKMWSAKKSTLRLLETIKKMSSIRIQQVLDYGCGNGDFSLALQSIIESKTQVTASDFEDLPPQQLINKVTYYSLSKLRSLKAHFDLIYCRHVLEHTADPTSLMMELKSLLSPGGILVIEIPSYETIWKSIFRQHWEGFYAPYHYHHFTSQSMRTLMNRLGLEILELKGIEMPLMGRSLYTMIGRKHLPYFPFFCLGIALHPIQILASYLTRTSTALRLVIRRP